VSAAGDRARTRIRRNRREFELLALSGAFGPIGADEPEETIEEFAAKVGCSVADLLASDAAGGSRRRMRRWRVCNPPAGASCRQPNDAAQKGSLVSAPLVKNRTQADRFADFMLDSAAHGPPIARGTVRRYVAEHAVEITGDVVRFADGSEIQRADGPLAEAR
jgi:hypothetical protein